MQRARRDRSGGVDLRRHIGEGRDHEDDHGHEPRRVAAVTGADEVGHRVTAELAQIRGEQRVHQHIAAGPADDEGEVAVSAEVDAAGQRDEGRAGHPVRRRRHAVEHGRHFAPGDIVGRHLHGAREPADRRVDHDREDDEQDADGVGAQARLLQDRHQDDEDDESAGIHAVDFRQILDEVPFEHGDLPLTLGFIAGETGLVVDLVLLPVLIEDQQHENDQRALDCKVVA